jgi:exodeoxyribonuclease VII small subunit
MSKPKNFEEALRRLENIVSELENGEIKLDDMLQLYEEGSELIKYCLTKLDDVEKKINILSADGEGRLKEEPLNE